MDFCFASWVSVEREQENGVCMQRSNSGYGLWTVIKEGDMWEHEAGNGQCKFSDINGLQMLGWYYVCALEEGG